MNKATPSAPQPSLAGGSRLLWQLVLGTLALAGLLSGAVSWFLPIDVVRDWAYEHAEADDFRRFEAVGHAEFLCWLLRIAGPLLLIVVCLAWRNVSRVAAFLGDAWDGLQAATRISLDGAKTNRWRTVIARLLLVVWGLLAVGHFGDGVRQRMRDWPYYRFRSGAQVLPNISDSNRDVIRFLKQSTPENARIFVASDQALFFLSYYLLPRRVYHKVHPESEHVIPLAHQQRRMMAFRLSELDANEIRELRPDYILEYFEHPDFVDHSRLLEDRVWVNFLRQHYQSPQYVPSVIVRLRRFEEWAHQ